MEPTSLATARPAMVEPIRPRDFNPQQLALIRKTLAADCTQEEFDLFVEIARRVGADPFRKQIYAIVYNKHDKERRKMSIIMAIDHFRASAARNRDYRPDDAEPAYEIDESVKGTDNPVGLVKAIARAYKYGPDGQWHPVIGVVYWNEFAVIEERPSGGYRYEETGETYADSGKPKKKRVPVGEMIRTAIGNWGDMPRLMLAKCAEAQALRKGWPEDLSGVYTPEEMERSTMRDITPSDAVAQYERDERLRITHSSNTIPAIWERGGVIEYVDAGKFADRCMAHISAATDFSDLEAWRETNTMALREFWALAKGDALAVKKALDEKLASLKRPEAKPSADPVEQPKAATKPAPAPAEAEEPPSLSGKNPDWPAWTQWAKARIKKMPREEVQAFLTRYSVPLEFIRNNRIGDWDELQAEMAAK